MRKKAKTLTPAQIEIALVEIRERSIQVLRDELYVLLTFCCGLRALEVANVEVSDITDVEGNPVSALDVRKSKYGKQRVLPLPDPLPQRFADYLAVYKIRTGPIFKDQFGKPPTPNAVAKQISRIYKSCGFEGASSHSGRRSFITQASRKAGRNGCSMEDVRYLAGHADLGTTAGYIELSDAQERLVSELWRQEWREMPEQPHHKLKHRGGVIPVPSRISTPKTLLSGELGENGPQPGLGKPWREDVEDQTDPTRSQDVFDSASVPGPPQRRPDPSETVLQQLAARFEAAQFYPKTTGSSQCDALRSVAARLGREDAEPASLGDRKLEPLPVIPPLSKAAETPERVNSAAELDEAPATRQVIRTQIKIGGRLKTISFEV